MIFAEEAVESWGRLSPGRQRVAHPRSRDVLARVEGQRLASGARRSYGDVGLLSGGQMIDMRGLDRFLDFDPATGLLRVEAGITLAEILTVFAPRGWFLPVVPGTKFVTVGGAIANDVHGKNQRAAGTFGCCVREITLLRGKGTRLTPGPTVESGLFAATIGGLGLTGTIVEAVIELTRIPSTKLDVETQACHTLDALCDALQRLDERHDYTVAWIDCTSAQGRGIASGANWAADASYAVQPVRQKPAVPTDRVGQLLSPVTLKLFNTLYFARQRARGGRQRVAYDTFFFPLDGVGGWNKLYGAKGFYQYQALIPHAAGREPIRQLLRCIAEAREGSFLAVLKSFGDRPSPGLLSFPAPGLTLALDFPNRGRRTLDLLDRLDAITRAAGGRLYPAKDARMPGEMFRAGFPKLDAFRPFIDPLHGSDFWKRVNA